MNGEENPTKYEEPDADFRPAWPLGPPTRGQQVVAVVGCGCMVLVVIMFIPWFIFVYHLFYG